MLERDPYGSSWDVEETIAQPHPPRERRSPVTRAGIWFFTLASLVFLGLASEVTWRWLDRNLLHWGMADTRV